MRDQAFRMTAWASFAFIVGYGAYLMLVACDLGIHPVFGLQYCKARAEPDRFANERALESDLRDRIHEAELRLARLPPCLASVPPSRPVPEQRAEAEVSPPPPPQPSPSPTPEVPPSEELKIPQQLSDLKGCWQSVRGDLPLVTDDREQRPLGNVRICYCFGDNGRGSVRYRYTDGRKCAGPVRARLSDGKLSIDQPAHCVVRTEITCSSQGEGNAASCDAVDYGRFVHGGYTDEKYQRVTAEHCR
jgi:hypothetical protein